MIAPRFSGHLDFLYVKKDGQLTSKFLAVDVELRHVQPDAVWPGIIERDSMWAYPNDVQFKKHLQSLITNYDKYKKEALELRDYVEEEFSAENILPKLASDIIGPPTGWEKSLEKVDLIE